MSGCVALVGCVSHKSDDAPAAGALVDSAHGEVAQYSLMKDAVMWLTDSNVVALAAVVNDGPVRLARIESQEASDPAVHALAVEVLRDHAAFQVSLDSIAAKRRIPSQRPAVAQSMQAPYDSAVTALSSVSAAQIEQQYLAAEKMMAERALTDFAAIAGNATDPDVRALIAIRGTTMEERHIAHANQLVASAAQADSAKQAARTAKKP